MSVVLDRPYRFIPPHRGNLWPSLIQRFRIVDYYLRLKEGVHSFECRNIEAFEHALEEQKGILLSPNHCRYADPLVMGWPARLAKTHVYAMASWHLFNKSWLDGFAIRKMGGFSINREASDRQSLETAIDILSSAERPLILFPEGTTSRMNDRLKDLLDGVTFIARSAARRSQKKHGRSVVILPVAIKYLCKTDCTSWVEEQLDQLEIFLKANHKKSPNKVDRVGRLLEHWLNCQELKILGEVQPGSFQERRLQLASEIMNRIDEQLGTSTDSEDVHGRVRSIRSEIVLKCFEESSVDISVLKSATKLVVLCQELITFDDDYLVDGGVTDVRLVETTQRLQEICFGKARQNFPLHAVIQFGDQIDVPAGKSPRGQRDPLVEGIRDQLENMLVQLSQEALTC